MRIYEFLRDCGHGTAPRELRRARDEGGDSAAIISEFAQAGDALANMALGRFVRIYGAQAGNLALTLYATGGVYVAGGIAPKIIDTISSGIFMEAFLDNPAMSHLLKNIPVRVVLNPRVGLMGATWVAVKALTGNQLR